MEIECPYCHNKVLPKGRFSASAFAALLTLGVIPFVLNILGGIFLLDAIRLLSEMSPKEVAPTIPGIIPTIPPQVTLAMERIVTSGMLLAVSYLILSLVLGLIPAVVYLASRRGSYKCPICGLPIG
jgi:hypothetical protein